MSETVHIPEHHVAGKRLGRHVNHDPRSWDFPAPGATITTPVLWKRHGRILNQGQLGSCTGNAVAGAVDTEPLYLAHHLLYEKQAVGIYELATQLDPYPGAYPPDDTGSDGLSACKAAKQLGYITSYLHAFGIDQAVAALASGPVITGVNWYEGFDHPDVNGYVKIAGQVRGGHEFEIHGYDPGTQLVAAVNSWGRSWGLNGYFFFSKTTWATLLAQQGDVTVPVRA
jgi:hypothetical protein